MGRRRFSTRCIRDGVARLVRRWETLVALLAVILASLAALQVPGRLFLALAAILLIGLIGMLRMRAAITGRQTSNDSGAGERARRIRDERERRLGGRR